MTHQYDSSRIGWAEYHPISVLEFTKKTEKTKWMLGVVTCPQSAEVHPSAAVSVEMETREVSTSSALVGAGYSAIPSPQ